MQRILGIYCNDGTSMKYKKKCKLEKYANGWIVPRLCGTWLYDYWVVLGLNADHAMNFSYPSTSNSNSLPVLLSAEAYLLTQALESVHIWRLCGL